MLKKAIKRISGINQKHQKNAETEWGDKNGTTKKNLPSKIHWKISRNKLFAYNFVAGFIILQCVFSLVNLTRHKHILNIHTHGCVEKSAKISAWKYQNADANAYNHIYNVQ